MDKEGMLKGRQFLGIICLLLGILVLPYIIFYPRTLVGIFDNLFTAQATILFIIWPVLSINVKLVMLFKRWYRLLSLASIMTFIMWFIAAFPFTDNTAIGLKGAFLIGFWFMAWVVIDLIEIIFPETIWAVEEKST